MQKYSCPGDFSYLAGGVVGHLQLLAVGMRDGGRESVAATAAVVLGSK
jgi:hypothetical protein